jgi:hypothetical protein
MNGGQTGRRRAYVYYACVDPGELGGDAQQAKLACVHVEVYECVDANQHRAG